MQSPYSSKKSVNVQMDLTLMLTASCRLRPFQKHRNRLSDVLLFFSPFRRKQ